MTKDVTHTLSLKESSAEVNGLERSCSLFYHSIDRMRDFHAYYVIFTHPRTEGGTRQRCLPSNHSTPTPM